METIKLLLSGVSQQELIEHIDEEKCSGHISFSTPKKRFDQFSVEPASIIVSGTSILVAIISGVIAYLAKKNSGKITIVGASGRKIEVPHNTPKEKIDEYIELSKTIDIDSIKISVN